MLLPLLMEIERASLPRPPLLENTLGEERRGAEPTRDAFSRPAGEGQVIETDKLRIKDLKTQGFSDQQISNMGLTAAVRSPAPRSRAFERGPNARALRRWSRPWV